MSRKLGVLTVCSTAMLQVVLLGLKLTNIVAWNYYQVFTPLTIYGGFVLAVSSLMLLLD